MINRTLETFISQKLESGKAIIVLGARQTGKTTLLKKLFVGRDDVLWLNADEPDVIALFDNATSSSLRASFAGYNTVVIDEAQRISDIGLKLKLITDQIPELNLVSTGSSAFDLAEKVNEPLTGRKWEMNLFPLSFGEMVSHHGLMEEQRLLHHRLLYGYYPEVVTSQGDERNILKQLSDSYLFKDILMWERIKKPEKLVKLLQALAFQIGNEVTYSGLGQVTGLDNQTVEKYIQLLEKSFVVFRLGAFSRNLRTELKRGRKIYFYDNGIRNALISNFAPPELRTDIGHVFENFLVSERIKALSYSQTWCNSYFWRTVNQQEIDYLEEKDGVLHAHEFKWNPARRAKLSKTFSKAYPEHDFKTIHRDNYADFLLPAGGTKQTP